MKNNFSILCTKILKPYITQQLVDNDFNVLEHNFIKIEPINNIDFFNTLNSKLPHFIFTSKNAVRCFVDQLSASKLKIKKNSIYYSLSGETQAALVEEGFKATVIADNAADLAVKIIKEGKIKEAIFLCGDKRKEELPFLLKEAAIAVNELILYKNILQPKKIIDPYQAILFFSPSALLSFFENNNLPKTVACFCIGYSTANALKQYKINNKIIVSNYPSQQNMVDTVLNYFNIKN